MKRINALVCVFLLLLGVMGISTINAAESEGFGGYPWQKISGYYLGTTEVKSTAESLEISFRNINYDNKYIYFKFNIL